MSALRAHIKPSQRVDLLWETLRAPHRPGRARTLRNEWSTAHVGGMLTGGLQHTDSANDTVVQGRACGYLLCYLGDYLIVIWRSKATTQLIPSLK